MKLTVEERDTVTLRARTHDDARSRRIAGCPGSREQPLSYAILFERRQRLVVGRVG